MLVKFRTICLVAASFVFIASPANAVTTLSLESVGLQQQLSAPCVFGDSSCENPPVFHFSLVPSDDSVTALSSPAYTVLMLRLLVADVFVMGIDLEQDQLDYGLDLVTLEIDDQVQFAFGPAVLTSTANGPGLSDYALSGFDLTSYSPSSIAVFKLTFHNNDGGPERFFLGVPEPVTGMLLLFGIGGLPVMRRMEYPRSSRHHPGTHGVSETQIPGCPVCS